MIHQDSKDVLNAIRRLAERDVTISTFLKVAEVEARSNMVGYALSDDALDNIIINYGLKKMLITILSLQVSMVEALQSDLAVANSLIRH